MKTVKHTFPSIPHIITTRCVEPRESMAIAACALLVLCGYHSPVARFDARTDSAPSVHHLRVRPAMRARTPTMSGDLSAMSYRELQQACKERGLRASGKADELRERLMQALPSETAPVSKPAAPTPPAPKAVVDTWPVLSSADDAELLGSLALDDDLPMGDGTSAGNAGAIGRDASAAAALGDDSLLDELLSDLESDLGDPSGPLPPGRRYESYGMDESLADALASLDDLDGPLGSPAPRRGAPDPFADTIASLASAADASEGDTGAPLATDGFDEAWLEVRACYSYDH